MASKKKKKGILGQTGLKVMMGLLLLAASTLLTGYFVLSLRIDRRFSGRKWSVPSVVWSDTVILYPGQPLTLARFRKMLLWRRYRPVARVREPGEFHVEPGRVDVFFRNFEFPGKNLPRRRVLFRFGGGRLEAVQGRGHSLSYVEMEPLEVAKLFGAERTSRLLVNIRQVSRDLIHAVVAIEDHRFYDHPGVDWWGIARALWADIRAGHIVQGGSTITQQLVKNYFLKPERTLKRKLMEAAMALVLELHYTKDDIMEMYLNEIYMGQRGSVEIRGMGEAARYYFGRNVEDLTLAEAATLAGMIRAPNRYSPFRHPDLCRERRDRVLKRMLELRFIASRAYQEAVSLPVEMPPMAIPVQLAPYFTDYVRNQLEQFYEPEVLTTQGLNIYTTLHPELAVAADEAVKEGLAELERRKPRLKSGDPTKSLQAVLIAVQPKTGSVLAMVGGRDYGTSSYNRALLAQRQPGSAFKPFVYLAALDRMSPTTWLHDEPMGYRVGSRLWTPRNYDGRYRGRVMFREALEKSLNAATVDVAMRVGLKKIIQVAKRLGIHSPLQAYPSLALGAFEVTPLELAGAFSTLANEGQRPFLKSLRKVVTEKGQVDQRRVVDMITVTTPAKAFIITSILEGVMERGTARSSRRLGIRFPCAGKTGTTSDYRDSWFVGYTSDVLVLVWVGFDDNRPTYLSGASGALRIWCRFMNKVRPWIHPQRFEVPPGVVVRSICEDSGLLATRACPHRRIEYFIRGHEPTSYCPIHGS